MLKYTLILLSFLSFSPAFGEENIWVVANVSDSSIALSKAEVRTLFMNNSSSDSSLLQPVSLVPGHRARSIFNAKVIALPESRIQSYWAQMRFSGRMAAPKEMDSLQAMLQYIGENEGAVGYVPAGTELPSHLTVVYASL